MKINDLEEKIAFWTMIFCAGLIAVSLFLGLVIILLAEMYC